MATTTVLAAGCGSNESPAGGGAGSGAAGSGGASGGGTAGSGGSAGGLCEPDDQVADPPCGAARCNDKCFQMNGLCKAGCQRIARAENTQGILFEGGYAYQYGTISLDRIDLATFQSERLPADGYSFLASVVVNGAVIWHESGELNRSEIGGMQTTLIATPSTYFNYIAELDGTVYLLSGQWLSIPLAAPAITELHVQPSNDVPIFIGYDEQYLYLNGYFENDAGGRTYRATNATVTTPELLCDDGALALGRIYGDYLYTWGTEVPTVYRRCPKTGGTFSEFATVATDFTDDLIVAKGDALYGVDDAGNLHRIRSATEDTVIARFEPGQASRLVTDGTSVYVATGVAAVGALFRILE